MKIGKYFNAALDNKLSIWYNYIMQCAYLHAAA